MSRKYRQPGYQDYDKEDRERERAYKSSGDSGGGRKPRDGSEGPRTPRMTGTRTVARCYNCGAVLPALSEQLGECGKCESALRCCKMCTHFDPGSQFECTEKIETRVIPKDRHTDCEFFALKTTVEKDTSGTGNIASAPVAEVTSRTAPDDARKAFDNLFKK